MTNIINIENRVSIVKKYLNILSEYKNNTVLEIINSTEKRGAIERYLYLAVQSTIDLAESIISFKKLRKPTTLSDCFYILEEDKFINPDLCNKMIQMTGFRNILSHDYEKIDYTIIHKVLVENLNDIENFLGIVEDKINL